MLELFYRVCIPNKGAPHHRSGVGYHRSPSVLRACKRLGGPDTIMFSKENDIIMKIKAEDFAGPLLGFATLAVGVGFVAAIAYLASLFTAGASIVQPAAAAKPETYDFFSAAKVATIEEPQGQELSCYDLHLLPVWNALKNDDEFSERVGHSNDSANCSDMLEVERVDLNRDGRKELLVRGKNFHLCGATGNCGFWVFEEGRTRPRMLLSASDYVDVAELGQQVLRSQTHGYADLLLKGHFSAAETGHYTYKFDGQKYIQTKCMYEVPKYDRSNEVSWEMITCEEFDRRIEREIERERSKAEILTQSSRRSQRRTGLSTEGAK